MSATLAELLKDIRADLGADFIASDIVGMDGMSIAGEHVRGDYEAEMVAAHFAMVMKLAGKLSGEMQMGEVRENQVNTEKAMVFSRQLADTDFFWLLATSREATLGIVRSLLDEYELRLYAAIPGLSMAPTETLALEARNIFKWFPGGFANDMVDFQLRKGEIHALLGENGAGKSTLMNIIYGLYSPDGGDIYVDGQVADITDPRDAIERRIGMVHQHFMLIPVFTVLENIILGEEDTRGPVLNLKAARQRVMALAQQYSLDVDPDSRVEDLPVGVQQRVEILKALYRRADVLVFDEPTAVLTPQESEHLFEVMRQLKNGGVSIIFITHKLKEVLAVADRITVMRNGKVIATTTPAESEEGQLAEMMVGRTVLQDARKQAMKPGAAVLQVEGLRVANNRDLVAVDGLSFEVHEREVLGIAGVQGNGQTELAEALTGLRAPLSGRIRLNGEAISGASPRQIRELGVAHVPEDRQRDGLVNRFPVEDNLVLTSYYKKPFSYNAVLQENVIEKRAAQLMADFDIRAAGLDTRVETLSGGNQQKVIIAREFSHPIRLLVAAQPTRGLDVGAIEYVHKRLLEKRAEGCAVVLISTELDEVLALSDRILVMYRGQAVATLDAAEASKEQLGLLMAGVLTVGSMY